MLLSLQNTTFKIICILFFQAGFFSLFAQQITLRGKITDTLNNPLEYANVLAIPQTEDNTIEFSICNQKGEYQLNLKKHTPYTIEISYLGYSKISHPVTLQEDTIKDFKLKPANESLDEVLLSYKQPVTVKIDTIIYRTDVFTTGEERKLRDVLKKLPGVEVDRAGNVTVNGKKVDKFMVDGEPFFSGDTKLGVNNIPADVVDEVEALDNYTSIPFLKGLNDSDVLALNIKLKEGKKKFIFGEIEGGGGVKERYLLNPTLFYYSPKTSVNFIGDLNNIGQKSFTIQDYINFEGGFTKLMENATGFSTIFNNDFAKYLSNTDFFLNSNRFGAFNLNQEISQKATLSAYSIVNGSSIETKTVNQNIYLLNNQITNIENRDTQTQANNFFSINKLSVDYNPDIDKNLTYETVIKTSSGTSYELLHSQTLIDTNFINSTVKPQTVEILQNLEYNTQFNYKHTSTVQASATISTLENKTNRNFSYPVFNQIIPLQEDPPFTLIQKTNNVKYQASITLKHYWVLNNYNHIYPLAGYTLLREKYKSEDFQTINNQIVDFSPLGFNNDIRLLLNNLYMGFQYKAKLGKLIIKPGVVYHRYFWNIRQLDNKISKNKGVFLPQMLIKWNIKNSEKLTLKYNKKAGFNNASFYTNRLRLTSFNSLYRGNPEIENSLVHNLSLRYYRFNLLKGVFINAGINYNKTEKSIRNQVKIEGINQINTSIYSDLPESNISFNTSVSKKIKKIKYTVNGNIIFSNYSRIVNSTQDDYKSNTFSYTLQFETFFKHFPNIKSGFTHTISQFSSSNNRNRFYQLSPFTSVDYFFLNSFTLKADYNYNYYENKNNNEFNIFQIGDFSLLYTKESSLWQFGLILNNAFDVRFKNQNSFDQFIVSDINTFIQPRTILFKVVYKL